MMEACRDPLAYLVDQLCCSVYLDYGGNVRLGFSRRHDLTDMMNAQGIARSNAGALRARLRQTQGDKSPVKPESCDASMAEHMATGACCPLV